MPTYSFGDDPLDADDKAQVRQVAEDLGLGRVRTLSVEGRDLAAQRWYDGDGGPDSPLAQSAPAQLHAAAASCSASPARSPEMFGVCANGDANDDGRVVSLDHGCGAHSEVQLAKKHEPVPLPDHVLRHPRRRRGRDLLSRRGAEIISGLRRPGGRLRRRRQYSRPNSPSPKPARQVQSHQMWPPSSSRP